MSATGGPDALANGLADSTGEAGRLKPAVLGPRGCRMGAAGTDAIVRVVTAGRRWGDRCIGRERA